MSFNKIINIVMQGRVFMCLVTIEDINIFNSFIIKNLFGLDFVSWNDLKMVKAAIYPFGLIVNEPMAYTHAYTGIMKTPSM